MKNKFNKLVKASQYSWVVATFLMLLTWLRIWQYAFSHTYHVIEDKFIYIGILGGWIFVGLLYGAIIFFSGYYIIGLIVRLAKEVNDAKRGKDE